MSDNKKFIIKKVPNILSTTRLGLGIVMPIAFIFLGDLGKTIYVLFGNLTDALDGGIARLFHAKSNYGKVMDPIADKFFNLMALVSAAIFINPFLLGIAAAEVAIARTTIKHGMYDVKKKGANRKVWKNIDTKGMKLKEKLKAYEKAYIEKGVVYVDAVKDLNVSRFGRKKAIVMVTSIISAFLTPIFPVLTSLTSALIITTTIAEIPVVSKYILEYHNDLGKISSFGEKYLSILNALDKQCDKLDEGAKSLCKIIIKLFKKVIGLRFNKKDNVLNPETLNNQDNINQSLNNTNVSKEQISNEMSNDVKASQELNNKNSSISGASDYYNGPYCYMPYTLYNDPSFEDDLGTARIKRI
jgi:phosphatidylglycerophosphate synthase